MLSRRKVAHVIVIVADDGGVGVGVDDGVGVVAVVLSLLSGLQTLEGSQFFVSCSAGAAW